MFAGEVVTEPEDNEKGNEAEPLTGNKRVLQDLLEGDSERPVMTPRYKPRETILELKESVSRSSGP